MEHNSAIYNPDGFDVDDVKNFHKKEGSLYGYSRAVEEEMIDPLSYMEKECDILIPAAVERSIHKDNADRLKCKVVVEGANGPTTFFGEEKLLKRGIIVVPDMLINVGGVTVSYFEWLKNLDHVAPGRLTKKYEEKKKLKMLETLGYRFPEHSPHFKSLAGAKEIDIVYSGLEEIMTTAVRQHWKFAVDNNLNFRDACLARAIQKLYKHYEDCGIMI